MALSRSRNIPYWAGTLEQMIRQDSGVRSECRKCGHQSPALDLEAFVRILGRDGSLWDRHPPCERGDCDGELYFRATPSRSGGPPWVLLYSDVMLRDRLPIQAWCGGWTGLR